MNEEITQCDIRIAEIGAECILTEEIVKARPAGCLRKKAPPWWPGQSNWEYPFSTYFSKSLKREEVHFLHNGLQRFRSGGNKNRDQSHLNQ